MGRIRNILFRALILITIPIAAYFSSFFQIEGNAAAASYVPSITNRDPIITDIPQEGIYDVMLDSTNGPLTYYNQNDVRWGNFLYGGKDPLSTYGCGPTVMAMIITSLTGNQVLPTEMANWAAANRGWCPGEGSYHRLIGDSATAYGLKAVPLKKYTAQSIQNALQSGHLIVALMKRGHFTQQGHFIIITRLTEDGKLGISDPNNYDHTTQNWDPAIILKELNYRASNGGPLWMISLPDSTP